MERKKLSLRLKNGGAPTHNSFATDEIVMAQALIKKYGRQAGQIVVDQTQDAIKSGDHDRASFLDQVRLHMMNII